MRHELGQRERDESLEELQVQYDRLVDMAEEHGLNAGVLMAGSRLQNMLNVRSMRPIK